MKSLAEKINIFFRQLLDKMNMSIRSKLILVFLIAKVIPLILITVIAWHQIGTLGSTLREIAASDSMASLNSSATENIERLTTDTAKRIADFLYARDDDILLLAKNTPSEEFFRTFINTKRSKLVHSGQWTLAPDNRSWMPTNPIAQTSTIKSKSSNNENNDMDGFRYRSADEFEDIDVPLYDEIAYIDLSGNEVIKIVAQDSPKKIYPMDPQKKDVSKRENTYVKAETYFDQLKSLKPGEIYVSDVIGAYVGSNYIGMYTPDNVQAAAEKNGYDINYDPQAQAYAGEENPTGKRFEGIIRWATPVTGTGGEITGYITFALNHDHIMEMVDHITPMNERYTQLPSAYEGNYAFIWDYKCRNISHPRHHSIVGFDPETGDPAVPWLETSIYQEWQASGVAKWTDFVQNNIAPFDGQSRTKSPAPFLTKIGMVGLDGRYLNNAPQCTGWMDLTQDGGSGSFYISWSGLYKLTTAAAIPYYTGQYAPSEANNYSKRGFAFVTIGAGLDDFTLPATEMEQKLTETTENHMHRSSVMLIATVIILIILVVIIAILLASIITGNITELLVGISKFRSGKRQFRFHSQAKDEFGALMDSFDDMADSLVDSVKNSLCIMDMDRIIIYMNEQALSMRENTPTPIEGTRFDDFSLYPPNSEYDPITQLERDGEAKIYYDENVNRYFRNTAAYFLSKDGKKIGYIVRGDDITDMVLEQLKAEEQRILLDKIFSASPDLIWYMDINHTYLAVNPRFSSIAGKLPEDFVGEKASNLFTPEIAQLFTQHDVQALLSRKPHYVQEQIVFSDGHTEELDSLRTPIFDANGAPVGLLGFARDVSTRVDIETKLRQTQLDLEQAVNRANKANAHKGEFLARMSHEIRTPMNAIVGITGIIQRKLATADSGHEHGDISLNLQQIEVSSQHLLRLLNDILDISKIESGKIELSSEKTEIHKLVNTVVAIVKPRCEEKGIVFEPVVDDFDPATFLCDSLRLRQVLVNLLGNAVKFTPENGTIQLRIENLGRAEDRTHIKFSVKDTGIGIPEESIATIFQSFEQANNQISNQYGGTGLGLAISQRIIEIFGGSIQVQSIVDQGSNFYFDIWLDETADDSTVDASIDDLTDLFKGKRMLLVDDVQINRFIVATILEDTGITIDEAGDGQDAIDAFCAADPGTYDIILMDIQMPNMDGYQATTAIRALDRSDAGTVPIIALTANAFKDDIDKAKNHGMNDHIAKPVELPVLIEIMARALIKKS